MITEQHALDQLKRIALIKEGKLYSSHATISDTVSSAGDWNRYAFQAIKRGDYNTAKACCVVVAELLGSDALK